ncbi:MAG TPA: hypothetical protein VLA30_08475 [Burkholderiales bacterium]|nr:hypothetical protein [Burkholderiales bacterium]
MNRRALAAAGVAALAAALGLHDYRAAGAADAARPRAAAPVASIAPGDAVGAERRQTAQAQSLYEVPRRDRASSGRDVFAPHSWTPPPKPVARPAPPPPPPAAPPPPPQPPALSLVYLGQLEVEGEETVYYLAQGDRVFAVSVGDTINGVYRVLPPEGRAIALLYLPLNIKQLLPIRQVPS